MFGSTGNGTWKSILNMLKAEVEGVAVVEARMDEGSGYCGSSGGIESVSDAAKTASMVMTGAGE